MRLDRFDLNLLVALDALLDERNVTRAGERLFIGQSAASGALSRLREYFGDELLVPVGRQLRLTPLAESLVEPVRDTLQRARAAIALKPHFDPATAERRFTVCASDYVTTVLLASVSRHIAVQAPGVTLDIQAPPSPVSEVFDRGGIDVLVMPKQYTQELDHPQEALFDDTHVCVLWSGHAHRRKTLTFDEYLALGHVAVRVGGARSLTFEERFLPSTMNVRRVECVVGSFGLVPLMVVGTQRVATLHRRYAEHFGEHLPLRLLPTPFDIEPVVETLCWPRHLQSDPAHAWLRGVITDCAQAISLRNPTAPRS